MIIRVANMAVRNNGLFQALFNIIIIGNYAFSYGNLFLSRPLQLLFCLHLYHYYFKKTNDILFLATALSCILYLIFIFFHKNLTCYIFLSKIYHMVIIYLLIDAKMWQSATEHITAMVIIIVSYYYHVLSLQKIKT